MASDFRSVAKARSGAVFKNGSGFVFTMEGEGGWVIGHWTAWVDRGLEHQVPSHLVLEVQSSHSTGIDEARPRFEAIANHSAALLSFVANTAIEQPVTEIMYDASPGLLKRDFRQAFVRDPEAWPLMGGRVFKNDELASFFETYFAEGAATARLRRGIYQYGLALQRWRFGTEHQALQHLWIAAENIRNLFRDKRTPKADRKEYAKSIGIPIEGSWQNRLDNVVMQEDVFNGDTLVFKAAMKASDALEHGYEDLSKIQAHAVEHGHAAFTHLRTALLRLIDPATSLPESLASRPPLDVDSRRKIIHGQLVSESPVDP